MNNIPIADYTSFDYNEEDIKSHQACAAIIKDSENRILMLDHIKLKFWTIPIGKVSLTEKVEEGLRKELREEVNIEIKDFKIIKSYEKIYLRTKNKIRVLTKCYLFEILNYDGSIKNNEPDKHKSLKFMSLDEIENIPKISDATKEAIKYLRTRKN